MVLAVLSLFVGGTVTAYRTYDYIEHDNDFCMSCHLMAEPFERFGRSAHRDLGCKACHKPTFAGRTQMALTQIIENPTEISVHAEVPNEKCASCHIEGDPEQWLLVERSAGHRAHLESEDPELDDLLCVQCHSSGVHEFAAVDKTCAQAGCHEDVRVQLGRMGDFTIHCAACHGFSAVLPEEADASEARAALAPTANECLSCHVMRTLVDLPPDEPHDQVCATCHNPHEQETPQAAGSTCATVGCHNDMRELTPFHRGLDHADVEDCVSCHTAHEFRVDGDDCMACHQDIYDDLGQGAPRTRVARVPGSPMGFTGIGLSPGSFVHTSLAAQEVPQERRRPLISTGEVVFRHGNHREVECAQCHRSDQSHGQLSLTSINDCRSCHHTAPVADDCRSCHAASVLGPQLVTAQRWPMDFSTGPDEARDVPFRHQDHASADCGTCHQEGLRQPAASTECNGCHQEHHEDPAAVNCMSCHEQPSSDAHTVESHLTCGGAGCHTENPLQAVPRSRTSCLGCHQDQVDHEAGKECSDCHALPAPRGGGS